jgi:hypothetical protein
MVLQKLQGMLTVTFAVTDGTDRKTLASFIDDGQCQNRKINKVSSTFRKYMMEVLTK